MDSIAEDLFVSVHDIMLLLCCIVIRHYLARSANPEPLQDRRTLSGRDRWPSMEGFSVMAHAQQYSDEDKTMRIACYVLCGLSVAILLGLLLCTLP
jgi:hypothetical protein